MPFQTQEGLTVFRVCGASKCHLSCPWEGSREAVEGKTQEPGKWRQNVTFIAEKAAREGGLNPVSHVGWPKTSALSLMQSPGTGACRCGHLPATVNQIA